MNKKISKRCAEILVERGYAKRSSLSVSYRTGEKTYYIQKTYPLHKVKIEPFTDTLEGRRQADFFENWLDDFKGDLWCESEDEVYGIFNHQWRLERIKWCLERLEDK